VTAFLSPAPVSPELTAALLALAGIRRGHVVLDLTPAAGLCKGLSAAAGAHGLVIAHQSAQAPLPLGAGCAVQELETVLMTVPTGGSRVARLMLVLPEVEAVSMEHMLHAASGSLAPGARVTVACRPNEGRIEDGLLAVLVRAGLRVVHAERIEAPEGSVAVAVGVPADKA
jgi:hypothetical protein